MRKIFALIFALAAASAFCQVPDQLIQGAGASPYTTIARNVNWGATGGGNIQNNFIFQPLDPNQGFCLFIRNNNPTNAHNVTVQVSQTGDPSLLAFANVTGQWFTVPTTTSFPASVPANTTVGISYKTTASASIAVTITGTTAQAGTPDTANIFAVQTNQSACGSIATNSVQGPYQSLAGITQSQLFPVLIGGTDTPSGTGTVRAFKVGNFGSGMLPEADVGVLNNLWGNGVPPTNQFEQPVGTAAANTANNVQMFFPMTHCLPTSPSSVHVQCGYVETDPLIISSLSNTDVTGTRAFALQTSTTNPTAGEVLIEDSSASTTTPHVFYKTLTISCSAACEIRVLRATTVGTCTAGTPTNLEFTNGTRLGFQTGHTFGTNCSVQPTLDTTFMYDVFLAANTTQIIDLKGLWMPNQASGPGGNVAFENVTAVTGVVSITVLEWEAKV